MSTNSMLAAVARKRVAGGGFVPTDIAGCKLWLDASQIVGLSDGDPVSTWADASGNGNDATQATGARQPAYRTSILNNLPVIRFDGSSNNFLQTPSIGISQPDTIFLVAKQNSTAVHGRFLDGTGGGRQLFGLGIGSGFLQMFAGGGPISGSVNYSGVFHVIAGIFNGASSEAWVDGVSDVTGNAGTNTLGLCYIGSDNASAPLTGDIAEVIIYDSALGTTDRQTVEAYLATKYGL